MLFDCEWTSFPSPLSWNWRIWRPSLLGWGVAFKQEVLLSRHHLSRPKPPGIAVSWSAAKPRGWVQARRLGQSPLGMRIVGGRNVGRALT